MSTKRQRREGPSSAPADHSSELPLLTSVSVVCRDATSQLQSLPHVISAINGFVDVTPTRSVEFACSIGSVRLLQRIIAGYEQQPDTSEERDPLFRQIQFSRGMKAACEAGQLIIVQWLARSPYFGACFMPTQAVCNAVRLGHMGVLEWLHANRTDICWRRTLKAVDGNHLDAAKWLQPMAGHHQSYGRRWIIPAAQVGNLEMVKWAYNLIGETPGLSREATEVASDNGRVHVVQWLLEQTGTNAPKYPDASGLLSKGGMEALEMLLNHVDNLPQECWIKGQVNAISSGHRDVAERLFSMGFELELAHEDRFSRAISTAAGKGHLDVLKWLAEHEQNSVFTSASMDSAAFGGKLDVLQWLSGNCAEDCTETGVAWAAKNGHLDVLRWLHENKPNGFSKKTMDEAASNNHIEVVEWLHTKRREGCTTAAMDGAANSGHLEMVKWLHSNRSEGCTTTAMDQAARNGHLEMVKWLHANRSEGCSPMAMDEAAGCGHLDVVKWLYDNCTEGSIASAIMSVVDTHPDQGGGNGSVMEWLLDRRTEDCTAYEMDAAARNSNLEAILPLHRQGNGSCTSDAISFVYLYARGREFLPWFYANYPDQAVMSLIPEEEEKLLLTSATEYRDQLISHKQSSDKSKPGPRDEE